MRAVDTNVLVRLLARDDARQVAAAERSAEGGVWVSTLALAESVWVLAAVYDRGPAEIASAVETLLNPPPGKLEVFPNPERRDAGQVKAELKRALFNEEAR